MSDTSSLPYATAPCPGIGGTLKREPAHFQVVEIPLYEPSGEGAHVYVALTREGRTTPDVVHDLARVFALSERDVGYAGLKDKVARTTQVFSLPLSTIECDLVATRIAGELGLEVHWTARHVNKLKRGHLAGNRFRVIVSDVAPDALERARHVADALASSGLPNFFGAQRGGARGRNVERGRELLAAPDERRGTQRSWAGRLLLSAYQSSLFNAWLAERMRRGWFAELLVGDIAKKRAGGAIFDVQDLPAEQSRFAAREITYTGPIFGARMRWAGGAPGEVERALFAEAKLDEAAFARAGVKGSRRAGLIRVDDLAIATVPEGLSFEFALPKGSYATVLLREFMKSEEELALAPEESE